MHNKKKRPESHVLLHCMVHNEEIIEGYYCN